jgi:hypothetical protein
MADRGMTGSKGRWMRIVGPVVAAAIIIAGCSSGDTVSDLGPAPAQVGSAAPVGSGVVNPGIASFAFEPFTGVPGNAADDLTRRLAVVSDREGLNLVRRVGAPATFRVKGYLTAIGNPTSTTISYIFDVYDASGRRLHRIAGQEPSGGTSGDPWSGITDDTLEVVAERTIAALKAWLASGSV